MSEQERGRQQLVPMGGSYTLEERERHAARAAAGLPPLGEDLPGALPPDAALPPFSSEERVWPPIDDNEAAAALAGPEQEDLE